MYKIGLYWMDKLIERERKIDGWKRIGRKGNKRKMSGLIKRKGKKEGWMSA